MTERHFGEHDAWTVGHGPGGDRRIFLKVIASSAPGEVTTAIQPGNSLALAGDLLSGADHARHDGVGTMSAGYAEGAWSLSVGPDRLVRLLLRSTNDVADGHMRAEAAVTMTWLEATATAAEIMRLVAALAEADMAHVV